MSTLWASGLPEIAGFIVIIILLFIWPMRRYAPPAVKPRITTRKPEIVKTYFLRWVKEDEILALQAAGIAFTQCNLGTLRQEEDAPAVEGEQPQPEASGPLPDSLPAPLPPPPAAPLPATDPDEDGILLDNEEATQAMRLLGWTKAAVFSAGVKIKAGHVFELVVYRHSSSRAAGTLAVSGGEHIKGVQLIHQISRDLLAPSLLTSIQLCFAREDLPDDGTFRIVFNRSASAAQETIESAGKVWGCSLTADQRRGYKQSGQGTVVRDPQGNALAELVGYNLYILCNLFNGQEFEQAVGLYTRILQCVQPILTRKKLLNRVVKEHLGLLPPTAERRPAHVSARYRTTISPLFNGTQEEGEVLRVLCNKLLAPVVGRNVDVRVLEGRPWSAPPQSADEPFRVVIWSSPIATEKVPCPPLVFGFPLERGEKTFLVSGQGVPVVDTAGNIIAEVIGDTLYVHTRLVRVGSVTEARIFARMLVEVAGILACVAKSDDTRLEEARHNYVSSCLDAVAPISPVDARLHDTLRQEQGQLHALVLEAHGVQQDLFRQQSAPEQLLGQEFDRLYNIASVKAIKVSKNKIVVTTDVLNCRDPRTNVLHEIGAFKIHIPTDGDDSIKWINVTRRVHGYENGMNAPHIYEDGHACLGNVEDLFPRLIEQRDFASAVQVAIAFVESVNVNDSAGREITSWPVARRTGTRRRRPLDAMTI